MLTFAPNISWLLPELTFRERVKAVANEGFRAIEFGFPSHADLEALKYAKDDLGLTIVLFNQDVPVWDRQNRGYLVDPARRDEFKSTLDQALEIAEQLEVLKIMLPVGVEIPEITREVQLECMVENLGYAAPLAAEAGVLLTIEALNPFDNPGYFLTSSRDGIRIVKEMNHPQVRFQFDTYHLERMEGNLTDTLAQNIEWIGHIQFADYPGRHEPGTGRLDFDGLCKTIDSAGYSGFIGLEYVPFAHGIAALNWVPMAMRV